MTNFIFILAGRADQAKSWAREQDLRPNQWRYVSSVQDIRGHENPIIIKVGTWYERPQEELNLIEEIYNVMRR